MTTIRIANSPITWGVIDQPGKEQPITFEDYLAQTDAAGYQGTDLGPEGFLPRDVIILSEILSRHELQLVSSYVSINFLDADQVNNTLEEAIERATVLSKVGDSKSRLILGGILLPGSLRFRNAGRIRPEMGMIPMQWTRYASNVDALAKAVFESTGIKSAYHHHCGTMVETPGETGMLLDYTDPDLVGVCLDTGHYAFAGGDPVRIFRSFSDRISFVHFKDLNPKCAGVSRENNWDYGESIQNNIFCELGNGFVDFTAVLEELDKVQYDGWIVVEQDLAPGTGNPLQSARRNRSYISRLGY